VYGSPALFTVVSQAMDVATEVWGKPTITVEPMTLITHLVIKDIRLYFNLREIYQ